MVAAGNDATGGSPASRRVVSPPCQARSRRSVASSVRMYIEIDILRAMFQAVNARARDRQRMPHERRGQREQPPARALPGHVR